MTKLRGASSGVLFGQLERLFGQGTAIGLTEGELLERFVTRRDEAAFEALVARYGPMVLGVCRHLLRDPNDVDDAFQATFLVLVKKAGSVRQCELLGNWLYGVAFRVATRARALAARRTARIASERDAVENLTAAVCRDDGGLDPTTLFDQSPWLHQEVSHLPDKYRTPIVLCYFEGLTHDEAASRLGWPLGTVKGRLARARELLRRRLTRRGVSLSTAALASQLASSDGHSAVPAALQLTTLTAARALAGHVGASLAATSVISMPVSALVEGVLQAMFASHFKSIALPLFLVAGTVATGITVGATQLGGGAGTPNQVAPERANSTAKGKAQGHSPGAQPTALPANGPIDTATVSPELKQELIQAAALFDTLLSSFTVPQAEDMDRLEQWSVLTFQAQAISRSSRANRLAAGEAHRDRMKKLYMKILGIPIPEDNRYEKYASIKLNQAEQILAAEKEDRKRSVLLATNTELPAGAVAPPESPKVDLSPAAPGAKVDLSPAAPGAKVDLSPAAPGAKVDLSPAAPGPNEKAPAPKPIDPPAQPATKAAEPAAAGGMMGGAMMMQGMGSRKGVDARSSNRAANREIRPQIAALAAVLAAREGDSQSKVILKKLEEPISMSFAHATPFADVLKYIRHATTTPTYVGIPIYVDPKGLEEATATLDSTVSFDLEGVPLKTTLRLMLKQIGLAYCVRDGVLIISSVQGINEELREAQSEIDGIKPQPALQ
jgi:RNA polymerase sigma factor (sigma-70 family)